MNLDSKIYVAGHNGMVGSSIVRELKAKGHNNLILKSSSELDLCRQKDTEEFFKDSKIDYVFLAAARVGGILANKENLPEFLYENTMIQSNVIWSAFNSKVKKLLFLGSSCIYPKYTELPIKEDQLLSGKLETSNEGYALAKICGLKLCEYLNKKYGVPYISLMPCNLFGPGDNFDPLHSHVMPALIRKFHEAKMSNLSEINIWGSGKPKREFLEVNELAKICYQAMIKYNEANFLNVGSGEEISIADLANMISDVVGFSGKILYDTSKPDGTLRKVIDSSKLRKMLNWESKNPLKAQVADFYGYFKSVDSKKAA